MSVATELREAADRLTAEPHCGGRYSDCACDYAEQMAGLFRDIATAVDEGRWIYDGEPAALDMARRINRAEVAA